MSFLSPLSLLLLSLLSPSTTHAYPGGIGGCLGGQAAVAGAHVTAIASQTGPIGAMRLQMVLNDEHVLRSSTSMDFTIGQDHTLTLRKIDDKGTSFRGFLFRLGPPPNIPLLDTTYALEASADPNTIVPFEQCIMDQRVGGLAHTNALLKDSVTGVLRMDEPARDLPLDVTVVIENRAGISRYYYQRFILNAVMTDTGPGTPVAPQQPMHTLAPALAFAPVLPPVLAPIFTGITTTTAQPTMTITEAPTMQNSTTTDQTTTTAPTLNSEAIDLPSNTDVVVINRQKEVSVTPKCGSLAGDGDRGGSAAQAKDCSRHSELGTRHQRQRRKLKGSKY